MKYKKYPSYKDSGVEWLGEIPNHWKSVKLKYLVSITTGNKDTENKEVSGEYPFFVRSKKIERINTYSYDGEAILTAGDGDIGKIFHYINGKFDFHQRVYMFYKFNNILVAFLYFYIQENLHKEVIKLSAKTTVDSLRLPMLQDFVVSIPPPQEQQQIAKFLDNATQKIDTLITRQEKLIELLKEKRQAVISHAVTKGLNPDVKFKDSGVEWLGDVPEDWGINKLRYVFKFSTGLNITRANLQDKGIPCVSYGEVHSKYGFEVSVEKNVLKCVDESYLINSKSSLISKGDFIFADTSEDLEGAGNFTHLSGDIQVFAGYHTVIAKLISESNYYRFIAYLLDSQSFRKQIRLAVKGVKVFSITQAILKNCITWIPPIEEQQEIANYLDDKTNKIDTLIEKSKQSIKLLKEKRTALISAAVTGKIDVRELVS